MQNSHYKQLLRDRGICVIIPTYNNVGTIADVVARTLTQCYDVIVVNDGSTDGTGELLRKIKGITLVDYEKNAGKGTALKRGFKKALDMGFAYAITLDGDNQHFPEDIPLLLEANVKNPGCIILGQRQLEGVVRSKGSKFANAFSNFWFCVQTLKYIPDTQTGYRLYPLHKLHGLSLLTSRYEAELELLVFSAWHGVKIIPVPINVYYPPINERVSHFRPALDFTRISILNTILCVLALLYGLPCAIIRFIYTTFYTLFALFVYLFGALVIITPFAFVNNIFQRAAKKKNLALHTLIWRFARLVTWLLGLFGSKVTIENNQHNDFNKPAILICNHQSHLDLIVQLSVSKKIIFLTNDWVWNSPFFGYIVRSAEYYPVSAGIDNILPKLKGLVDRGYSISIFPEGTRSMDCSIARFHKGAFHLASELGLDIVPMILYGTGKVLPKKGWYMRRWPVTLAIKNRFTQKEIRGCGETEREICKWFRKFFKKEYAEISNRI